jgi:hypothetical protein
VLGERVLGAIHQAHRHVGTCMRTSVYRCMYVCICMIEKYAHLEGPEQLVTVLEAGHDLQGLLSCVRACVRDRSD